MLNLCAKTYFRTITPQKEKLMNWRRLAWLGCSVTRWLDYFQYWAIFNNVNWPKKHTNFPKVCWFFSYTKLSFEKLPKYLQSFAKVAKFRQIWSRWLLVQLKRPHNIVVVLSFKLFSLMYSNLLSFKKTLFCFFFDFTEAHLFHFVYW